MNSSTDSGDAAGNGGGSAKKDEAPRKARVIDGTAEDVTGGGGTAGSGRALAVAVPVFAFFAGAALLAAVLWQAGLLGALTGAGGAPSSRLDAAETRVEALLRDVERLGAELRTAQSARDDLAARLADAEAALEATGAQTPDTLARAEDLDAALRLIAEMDARLEDAETAVAALPEAVAPERVAALEAEADRLASEIADVGAVAARAADADRRIAAIETGIAAVGARQETLAGEIGTLRTQIGALEAGTEATTAGLASQGERLDAQAGALEALDARLAVAEARVDRPEAARRAALGIALASLAGAVSDGAPYADELAAVRALAPGMETAAGLEPMAEAGVPDAAALLTRFRPAARDALRAAAAGEAEGWWERLAGNALSLVTVRRTGDVDGADAEAVLARAEAALLEDDVAAAAAEVATLTGPAADAMADWLALATARARAEALVAEVRTSLLDDLAAAHAPASAGAGTGDAGE